jgi:hypothetical protein
MSNRKRVRRRTVTRADRLAYFASLATEVGQTAEEVEENIAEAVRVGYLIETADGWQAALPADVAGPDWTGPVT